MGQTNFSLCTVLCKSNASKFQRISWLFDEISFQTKFRRYLDEFSQHLLFEPREFSSDNSLRMVTRRELSSENSLFRYFAVNFRANFRHVCQLLSSCFREKFARIEISETSFLGLLIVVSAWRQPKFVCR